MIVNRAKHISTKEECTIIYNS